MARRNKGIKKSLLSSDLDIIGDEDDFVEVRKKTIDSEVFGLCLEFWIDIALLVIITTVILIDQSRSRREECNIPVRLWVILFFAIWFSKSLINLFKICVLRRCYGSRNTFSLVLSSVVYSILILWVAVGTWLYFSDANNCGAGPDSTAISYVMLTILIISYIAILIYFILLCVIPCCFVKSQNEQQNDDRDDKGKLKNVKMSGFFETLSKTRYDPQLLKYEDTCKICLEQYKSSDKVLTLRCNESHYFHSHCI